MAKIVSRWGRVAGRVFRLYRQLFSIKGLAVILGGAGFAAFIQQRWGASLFAWFHADSAHQWLVGVTLLCVLILLALYGAEKDIDVLKRDNFLASFDQLVQLQFGPNSTHPIEIQRQNAINEFELFEAEILRGDFSHRHEMLTYYEIVLRLLKGAPPLHLHHYTSRAEKVLQAINTHDSRGASS